MAHAYLKRAVAFGQSLFTECASEPRRWYGEMIELPEDTYALALNLERDSVGAVVLGEYEHISRRRHRQDHRPHSRSAGR
jgi:hypothetical protein